MRNEKNERRNGKKKMWIEGADLDCIIDMYDVVCIEGQETTRMGDLVKRIKREKTL